MNAQGLIDETQGAENDYARFKLRRFKIATEALAELVGLPPGQHIVLTRFNEHDNTVTVYVQGSDFDYVPPGQDIPEFTFTTVTIWDRGHTTHEE